MAPTCPHADGIAEHDGGRDDGKRRPFAIRRKRAHHRQHRLRDDGDGRDLEPMQPAAAERIAGVGDAVGEQHERNRRRQRKSAPRRERAEISRARQADGDRDLGAGRAGQELRQRDQIGVGLVVEPAPAHDERFVEIAEVRDRAAEAGEAETQERGEDFADAAVAGFGLHHAHTITP